MHIVKGILFSVALGILVCFAGFYASGLLAAFMLDHRYLGLPVTVALVLEDLIVWVPLTLIVGAIIAFMFSPRVIASALAVAVVAVTTLLFGLSRLGMPLAELPAMLSLYRLPIFLLFVLLPLGAYAARRLRGA